MANWRLWERTENAFEIHDYLDHNPSREDVLAEREAKQKGRVAGGKSRAADAQRDGGRFAPAQPQLASWQSAGPPATSLTPAPVPVPVPPVEVEVGTEVPTASAPAIPSNPFILYRDLTGGALAGRAEAWLNDYVRDRKAHV